MNSSDNPYEADLSLATPPRPTSVRFGVALLLALAGGSAYLTRHCIAVANTTIQEELGFNNAQMGLILGAFAFGYLLCQVPGGWLGNRFGTRGALAMLSILWSVFTVWTAAVSTMSQLIASRFAFGLAQAGLVPLSAKVVKDWFPPGRRGFISSIIAISMSIGAALTMELTAVLLESFHWRWVFRLYSLVGIAWAAAFYFLFRTLPRQHPWVNDAECALIEREDDQPQDLAASKPVARPLGSGDDRLRAVAMLRSVSLWAVCSQSFFRAAGYNLFVTFFPAFLEFAYGISRKDAGSFTKWPLLGVIAGGLLGGLLVDAILQRTGNKWLSRCGVAVVSLGLTAAFVLASSWTTTAGGLVAVISIGAMCSGLSLPCSWVGTIDIGGRHTAVIVGVMNMAGCLSGVIVTPLLGRLIDGIKETEGDWNLVIYLHVAFYAAAAASWIFVNPNKQVTG